MHGYNRPPLPLEPPPQYAYGGFLSQSWVKTSKGVRLSGPSSSTVGSFQRSEAGLFGTYSINPSIDFRGMVSSFKDGNFERGSVEINYALIDVHDADSDYGVRLGWVSNSAGFYSEQLNIPAYRDMELAPQGLYKEAYRNFARGGQGIQMYAKLFELESLSASIEGSLFRANISDQKELVYSFFGNNPARFKRATINTISFRAKNSKGLVFRYDRNGITSDVDAPSVFAGEQNLAIHRFGLRQYFQFGDLTAETAAFKFSACGGESCVRPFGQPVASSLTYRHYVTPTMNLILGYDTYFIAQKDKTGKKTETLTGEAVQAEDFFARSVNLALQLKRGHFTYKAELHHVEGRATLMATENDLSQRNLPKSHNILMLNVSYGF